MSEYMIDGALLTNIADAVRAVDGSSNTLTPAQMQARLTAVKSSIDAALSALTAKEVEVPSGSNIHGLADLIAAIKVGVSAPGFAKVTTGEKTLSTTWLNLSVSHGLGKIPDVAILYDPNFTASTTGIVASILLKSQYQINAGRHNSSGYGAYIEKNTDALNKTECNFNGRIQYGSGNSNYTGFSSGKTYKWIAGVYA